LGDEHKFAGQACSNAEVARRVDRAADFHPIRAIPVQDRKVRALLAGRDCKAHHRRSVQWWRRYFRIHRWNVGGLAIQCARQFVVRNMRQCGIVTDRAGQEDVIAIGQDQFGAAVLSAIECIALTTAIRNIDDIEGRAGNWDDGTAHDWSCSLASWTTIASAADQRPAGDIGGTRCIAIEGRAVQGNRTCVGRICLESDSRIIIEGAAININITTSRNQSTATSATGNSSIPVCSDMVEGNKIPRPRTKGL